MKTDLHMVSSASGEELQGLGKGEGNSLASWYRQASTHHAAASWGPGCGQGLGHSPPPGPWQSGGPSLHTAHLQASRVPAWPRQSCQAAP